MVILGAGASYDSDPNRPVTGPQEEILTLEDGYVSAMGLRPPLAQDLFFPRDDFGDFINAYPQVRPLVPQLRAASAGNSSVSIEAEFEKIVVEAADRPETARQVTALKFYLRAAIEKATETWAFEEARGATNQYLLVDQVDRWAKAARVAACYVTFNYDTLLERAASEEYSLSFENMDAYMANPQCQIFKLHGSIDWSRLANGMPDSANSAPPFGREAVAWLLRHSHLARLTREFEVARPGERKATGQWLFPAIAVPTQKKTEENFELPAAHIEALKAAIPNVTRVIVIGWRGLEEHFWKFWDACGPNRRDIYVEVVDANEEAAVEVAKTIQKLGRVDKVHVSPARGFTEYIAHHGEVSQILQRLS